MVMTTVRAGGKAGVMRVREEKGQPYCARSFAEPAYGIGGESVVWIKPAGMVFGLYRPATVSL